MFVAVQDLARDVQRLYRLSLSACPNAPPGSCTFFFVCLHLDTTAEPQIPSSTSPHIAVRECLIWKIAQRRRPDIGFLLRLVRCPGTAHLVLLRRGTPFIHFVRSYRVRYEGRAGTDYGPALLSGTLVILAMTVGPFTGMSNPAIVSSVVAYLIVE
jgi:hypothetical protein